MNITAAFTNFNRTTLLYEALEPFVKDDRINEIVISDDHSNDDVIADVWAHYEFVPKVMVYKNPRNLDCYLNKRAAVERAKNEWVLILDSDNQFDKGFIDRIENLWVAGLNPKHVYQPDFANPHFNFTGLSGQLLSKSNIASFINDSTAQTMLNAMNYLVNRDQFLQVFDDSINPVTSDSIFHNYNWLNAGNSIYVVPELQYGHRVHEGSHYKEKVRLTPRGFNEGIVEKLKQMK